MHQLDWAEGCPDSWYKILFFFWYLFIYSAVLGLAARGILHSSPQTLSCGAWAQLLYSMWDLSSLIRDQTQVPCTSRQTLKHWTTREVPRTLLLNVFEHFWKRLAFESAHSVKKPFHEWGWASSNPGEGTNRTEGRLALSPWVGTFIFCLRTSALLVLGPSDSDWDYIHHWLPWFQGCQTWIGTRPLAILSLWLADQIMGLLNLHNLVNQFFIINLFLYSWKNKKSIQKAIICENVCFLVTSVTKLSNFFGVFANLIEKKLYLAVVLLPSSPSTFIEI